MTVRRTTTRQRLHSAALPAACWVWSRAVLLMLVYNVVPYISHGDIIGDVRLYDRWSFILAKLHFPAGDPQWQYPPGAAVVIAVPRVLHKLTGISYYSGFYLTALLADLATFLLVVYSCWRTADRRERAEQQPVRVDYTGAWAYVGAIFMLGPIVFGRYDVIATLAGMLGLVAVARGEAATWRLRGAAIGVGVAMKLWPAALLFGLPRGARGRRAVWWAVLGALVPCAALALFMPGAFSFLSAQGERGLEVEAVLATPFLIARHFGYPGRIVHEYGAFQIAGPGVDAVSYGCLALTAAGFAWLLWWRRRAARALGPGGWTPAVYCDAALVAVLITTVTSRVLSPQYLVWFIGLIALCLTLTPHGAPGGTALAKPCWLLLAAIALTQIDFPLSFGDMVHGALLPAIFVTGRNAMLVAATLWAMRLLWTSTVRDAPKPATASTAVRDHVAPTAVPTLLSVPFSARRRSLAARRERLHLSVADVTSPEFDQPSEEEARDARTAAHAGAVPENAVNGTVLSVRDDEPMRIHDTAEDAAPAPEQPPFH